MDRKRVKVHNRYKDRNNEVSSKEKEDERGYL